MTASDAPDPTLPAGADPIVTQDGSTPAPTPEPPGPARAAPRPLRARAFSLARWLVLGLALFASLRLAVPALGTFPRTLTAEESDTLLGGHRLVDLLTARPDDPRLPGPGLKTRLKAGFETTATNPRLRGLEDKPPRRAALEAPVPRYLAALGVGLLPTTASATNLERAQTASALAMTATVLVLLVGFRRRSALFRVALAVTLLTLPGALDAALSAGYGASAALVMALALVTLERLVATGRGSLGLGLLLGLALGIHPFAIALTIPIFIAWALRPGAGTSVDPSPGPTPGQLVLPSAPVLLYLVPVLALVVLVALWPALWNETGKRLGAWLLDLGSTRSAPQDVLEQTFDQATSRAPQAFTALLQWLAWTPLPVLGLWLVGFAGAVRDGRHALWSPILFVATLLFAGALDGGLFGARLSLLPLLWVPTALTAADGAARAALALERRLASCPRPRWLAARTSTARAALLGVAVLIAPVLQAARGTTLGLARQTGSEARVPVPLALLREAVTLDGRAPLHAVIHALPDPEAVTPALELARTEAELDLWPGTYEEASLLVVTNPTGRPLPEALSRRLDGAVELARDPRPGVVVSLWRKPPPPPRRTPPPRAKVHGPGPLDKRDALPH